MRWVRLECVARAAHAVFRLDLPQQGLSPREGQLCGRGDVPGNFAGFTGGNLDVLNGQFQQRGTRRHRHLHRLFGGVAQRELGSEAVALAHQRRQPADELQVLRGWIVVCPVPNRPAAASATATMRKVVSASLSGTFTTAWPLASSTTAGFHSSRVSSSSRAAALAAAAACGHGLAAVVAPADDFHLRGGGLHAPGARCSMASSRFQLVLGISSSRPGPPRPRPLGAGGGLAVGQLAGDRTLAVPRTG
jgi:hypothetical protein